MGNTASSSSPSSVPSTGNTSTSTNNTSVSSSTTPSNNNNTLPTSKYEFPEAVTGNKDDARLQRLKRPNSIKEVSSSSICIFYASMITDNFFNYLEVRIESFNLIISSFFHMY